MIAGLILAAGESRRMGRDKALLTYHGRTFLETIIQNLRKSEIEQIAVVLGHHADQIRSAVNLSGVRVVVNPHYEDGQTSSLQIGLATLAAASPEAILLCLVDHPAISAEIILEIKERFESTRPPVIIPTFQGQRGHPVLISQAIVPELLALRPQEGADTTIRKYRAVTQFVEVAEDSILLDVDNPAAYERLERPEH
jgi:molybdenum cofactor cytidylyltransferase